MQHDLSTYVKLRLNDVSSPHDAAAEHLSELAIKVTDPGAPHWEAHPHAHPAVQP
jgi:hypothetical protein